MASVTKFRQLTTSQLRRLHFTTGTIDGRRVRSCRHLKRLTEVGRLTRMWCDYSGVNEYVYQLATTKARTPEPHTLDIAELYVRLVEAQTPNLVFRPEPECHTRVGHVQLKPDGYIECGGFAYWLELDRGVEWEAQLTAKMRRYVQTIDSGHWPKDRAFPICLWVVPDEARKRYLEDIIHKLGEGDLFSTVLFSEGAERVVGSGRRSQEGTGAA